MRLIEINTDNPQPHKINEVVKALKKGEIIIYPTDSVYAFGCDLYNQGAIEKLCQMREEKPNKKLFSFVCKDISQVSEYARQFENHIFKLMKKILPGPYTFILNASQKVPKAIQAKKKTVGVRIPQNNIALQLVEELGNPMITSTVKIDEATDYGTEPWFLAETFQNHVAYVIDGGSGGTESTTIIDCTSGEIEITREGKGDISEL